MHTSNSFIRRLGAGAVLVVTIIIAIMSFTFVKEAAATSVVCDDVKALPFPAYYMTQTDGAKFGVEVTENTPDTVKPIQHGTWCTDPVNAAHAVAWVKYRLDDVPLPTTAQFRAKTLFYLHDRKAWQDDVGWVENRLGSANITEVTVVSGKYHTFGQVMGADGIPDLVSDVVERPVIRVIKYTFGSKTVMFSLLCRFQGVQLEDFAPGGPSPRESRPETPSSPGSPGTPGGGGPGGGGCNNCHGTNTTVPLTREHKVCTKDGAGCGTNGRDSSPVQQNNPAHVAATPGYTAGGAEANHSAQSGGGGSAYTPTPRGTNSGGGGGSSPGGQTSTGSGDHAGTNAGTSASSQTNGSGQTSSGDPGAPG